MKTSYLLLLNLALCLGANAEVSNSRCELGNADSGPTVSYIEPGWNLGDIISSKPDKKTEISPVVQLDTNSSHRVVNLTPSSEAGKALTLYDYRNGFQIIDTHDLEYGLGAEGSFLLGNTTGLSSLAWLNVGILPVRTEKLVSARFAKNKEMVNNLPKINAVPNAKTLRKLTDGDAVTYMSRGGIIFWAGIGPSLISLDVSYYAGGEFQSYIEKLDADHVFVRISDKKIESFGVQTGAVIVAAESAKYNITGKSFSFLVNYNSELGAKVYSDLLRGNIAAVQKLALTESSDAVKIWDNANSTRNGHASTFKIGVPYLFHYSWGKQTYSELTRVESLACDRELKIQYGVYMKEKDKSNTKMAEERREGFYGASFKVTEGKSKVVSKGFFGQLLWNYSRDGANSETLKEAMDDLDARTGLGELVNLTIPEDEEDLEFTSLSLRMHFNANNTKSLIHRVNTMDKSDLVRTGLRLVNEYFSDGTDEDGICGTISDLNSCRDIISSKVKSTASAMYDSVQMIERALDSEKERAATLAYAKFGENMLTNQFTFQLGTMLAGKGLNLDYVVEGTDISSYVSTLENDETGKFSHVNRKPIYRSFEGRGGGQSNFEL